MASVSPISVQGEVYPGLYTSGRIPDEILKSGMDDLGKVIHLTRKFSKFAHFIHQTSQFGGKGRSVEGRIIKDVQISELERYYTVTVASTDTNHRTFGIPNNEAAQIQPDNMLANRNIYTYIQRRDLVTGQVIAGGGANLGPDLLAPTGAMVDQVSFSRVNGKDNQGNYFTLPEQLMVTEIGAKDSAGQGHTLITVERCYKGPSSSDAGGLLIARSVVYGSAGGTDTGIYYNINTGDSSCRFQEGDRLLRLTPSHKEGTNAPEGVYKNVEIGNNFTQEFKYGLSHTLESELNPTWITESPLETSRWLTTTRMIRDYELQIILGQKTRERDMSGRDRYNFGGILEFIPQDSDHYINYEGASLGWAGLLTMGVRVFNTGSQEKYAFCGYSLDAALRIMFYESGLMRIDPEASKEFNVEVNTIVMSGGKLNIVPTQIMEDIGFGNKAVVLDFGVPSFNPIHQKGWDLKVQKNIQEPGLMVYKEQIVGIRGLQRFFADYHRVLDFKNVVPCII